MGICLTSLILKYHGYIWHHFIKTRWGTNICNSMEESEHCNKNYGIKKGKAHWKKQKVDVYSINDLIWSERCY